MLSLITGLILTPTPALAMLLAWKISTIRKDKNSLRIGIILSWSLLLLPPFAYMKLGGYGPKSSAPGNLGAIFLLFMISLGLGFSCIHMIDRTERSTRWNSREAVRIWLGTALVDFFPMFLILLFFAVVGQRVHSLSTGLQVGLIAAVTIGASYLLFYAYPSIVMFLWKGSSLADGEMRHIVDKCIKDSGIYIHEVVVLPARRGKIANAMVSGIVPSRRVIFLTDYLIEKLTPREASTIIAHELGHIFHGHLFCNFLLGLAAMGLFTAAMHGLSLIIPPSLEVVMVEGVVLGFVMATVFASISRRFEKQADLFALRLTRDPEALKQALSKLEVALYPAKKRQPRLLRWLQTHPDLMDRIRYIDAAAP